LFFFFLLFVCLIFDFFVMDSSPSDLIISEKDDNDKSEPCASYEDRAVAAVLVQREECGQIEEWRDEAARAWLVVQQNTIEGSKVNQTVADGQGTSRPAPFPTMDSKRVHLNQVQKKALRDFYGGAAATMGVVPDTVGCEGDQEVDPDWRPKESDTSASTTSRPRHGPKLGRRTPGPFKCEVCSLGLGSQLALDNHRDSFHAPVHCDQCGVFCTGRAQWRRHLRAVHPNQALKVGEYEVSKMAGTLVLVDTVVDSSLRPRSLSANTAGRS